MDHAACDHERQDPFQQSVSIQIESNSVSLVTLYEGRDATVARDGAAKGSLVELSYSTALRDSDRLVLDVPDGDVVLFVVHAVGDDKVGRAIDARGADALDDGDVENLTLRQRPRKTERVAPADRTALACPDRFDDADLLPQRSHRPMNASCSPASVFCSCLVQR